MSTKKLIYQLSFLTTVCLLFLACPPMRSIAYELENPAVYAFRFEKIEAQVDSINFQTDTSYTYDHRPYYVWINDSLILYRKYAYYYYNEHEHADQGSGKVRLQQKIIRWKKDRNRFPTKHENFKPYEASTAPTISTPSINANIYPLDSLSITTSLFGQRESFHFKNALLNGEYILWYDSTKIKTKGQYIDGLEVGDWTSYDSLGQISQIQTYNTGELQSAKIYTATDDFYIQKYPTKSSIKTLHIFISSLLVLLLLVSFFYYRKWYEPVPSYKSPNKTSPLKEKIPHILHLVFSIIFVFVPVVLIYLMFFEKLRTEPIMNSYVNPIAIASSLVLIGLIVFSIRNWYTQKSTVTKELSYGSVFYLMGLNLSASLAIPICILPLQLLIALVLKVIGWDIPFGLEYIVFAPFLFFFVSLIYFTLSHRYKDFAWLCFWGSISILLLGDYVFLSSL